MPNIGLVLAGGFAKGAYQIGLLKAVEELSIREHISCICASSVGAANAYAYAHGKLDVIEEMWNSFRYTGLRSVYGNTGQSSFVSEAIAELAKDTEPVKHNLYVTCFNITKICLSYINLMEVGKEREKDYLLASMTLPFLSRPVEIDGIKYYDGALVDNIPVKPLMNHPFDYAIVIHFDNDDYEFENSYFDKRLLKINFLDEKLVKSSLAFDHKSITNMIEKGYSTSKSIFEIVFKNGIEDLDYIHNKLQILNEYKGIKKSRLTGDVVWNNINKAMKKIIRYSI